MMFGAWLCNAWLARQVLSPALMRSVAHDCPPPGRGVGVVLAVLRPRNRETGVEDAPGRQRATDRVVDHRQWSDRGEMRRSELRDEQLGDRRVGQADHADLVVRDPRLRRDRLDRVVPVGRLQLFKVVERAA